MPPPPETQAQALLEPLARAVCLTAALFNQLRLSRTSTERLHHARSLMIGAASQANMVIEIGLRVLVYLSGKRITNRSHQIGIFPPLAPKPLRAELEQALEPIRRPHLKKKEADDEYVNWRIVGSYGSSDSDLYAPYLAELNDEYLTEIAKAAAEIALLATDLAGKKMGASTRPQIEEVISQALDLRSAIKTT